MLRRTSKGLQVLWCRLAIIVAGECKPNVTPRARAIAVNALPPLTSQTLNLYSFDPLLDQAESYGHPFLLTSTRKSSLFAHSAVEVEQGLAFLVFIPQSCAWKSVGFRSPSMLHNLDWLHELDVEYDSSTFDTDPFEPQPDGVETIFPFWVSAGEDKRGYVELPYTLPQDWTLFVLMREGGIDLWKKKLDWIVEQGGMVFVITNPDYMNFDARGRRFE